MNANDSQNVPLPPGWEAKFDPRTNRYYFINHYTKATTWEDPRVRYQQIGKPVSSSAASTSSKENTRHGGASQEASASEGNTAQDISNRRAGASQSGRRESHNVLENISEVDSQISNTSGGGTSKKDDGEFGKYEVSSAVAAISSMFPTVDESHIRDLLKKTNCQITSDLLSELRQLERKNTGKYASAKPASQKKKQPTPVWSVFGESGENSPRGVSPEAKVDPYLKSVFPTVEEYLLLDILSNSDNNVQKAADKLVKMGYVKRDTPSAPRLHARKKEEERLAEKRTPLPKPPQLKSDKEKQELRRKMCNKYEKKYDIPERILFMALESVLYDEDQANNLIMSMIEDDLKRQKSKEAEKQKEKEKRKSPKPNRRSLAMSEGSSRHSSPKHEPKGSDGHGKKGWTKDSSDGVSRTTRGTSTQQERPYKSQVSGKAKGPNPSLRKGPNDDLLLTDYVTWNGPDHDNRKGPNKSIAKGPNMSLRSGPSGLANGPNPALRKGPSGKSNGPSANHLVGSMANAGAVPRPQGLPVMVSVM